MKRGFFILFLICITGTCLAQYHTYYDDDENWKFERWRVSISGGPGYIYSSSKDAENDLIASGMDKQKVNAYYKNFKWGWQGNADLHYLFNSHIGVGVKYALFQTQSTLRQLSFGNYNEDGLHIFFGDIEDKLYINFVGPSFLWQNFVNRRETWKVVSLISIGYANYRGESHIMEYPLLITSHTFGVYGESGLEYYINRNVAVGAKLNYITSSFEHFKVKNSQRTTSYTLTGKEKEDLNRFEFSLGFRFYF